MLIRSVAGWLSSLALGLVVVGPLAALGVCALVDLGSSGEARASLFPLAIAALDPFIWTCLRDSATTAGLAALTSIVVGVGVGRLISGLAGPPRTAAWVVLAIAAASPPFVLALGASALLGEAGPPFWSILIVRAGRASRYLPGDWGWFAWFAASALPGTAAAALAYSAAVDRLDPSWRDAARMTVGGARAWRRLAWPLLRPEMARVGGAVFASTLVDPGPPLILGLRRTFGFQVVLEALADGPFPELAVLGLMAVLACTLARSCLRLWSGPSKAGAFRPSVETPADRPRSGRSPARTATAVFVLGATAMMLAVALFALARAGLAGDSAGRGARVSALLTDPTVMRILARSLVLGVGVAALSVVSGKVANRLEASAGPAAAGRFRRLFPWLGPPPLVAGIVVLAMGRLIGLADAGLGGIPSHGLEVVRWMEGTRTPLLGAIFAVWLATIANGPWHPPSAAQTGRTARSDAAILAGAGRGRARRLARAGLGAGNWRGTAATAASAAANVAPAILLASSPLTATLGPGALLLLESPEHGFSTASLLALAAWCVSVLAMTIGPGGRAIDSTSVRSRA